MRAFPLTRHTTPSRARFPAPRLARFTARQVLGVLFALASSLTVFPAGAADTAAAWPTRPVRILVGSPPGQAIDIIARVFAEDFSKAFGQQFFVENRAGAGGSLATSAGAKAAPDGYTLLVASSGPMVIGPAINAKTPYDPERDFAPIANIALTPQTMLVGAASPYKSVADVMAAASARPGQLNFASTGVGSTGHLAMELFLAATHTKLFHIPYKGNQESAASLIAGDTAAGFDTVPGSLGMIKNGNLRALAVAAPQRSPFVPDVPTFAELGISGVEAVGWIGLAAPAGTPPAILERLNQQIRIALASTALKERFNTLAFVPVGDSREQFAAYIKSERARWAKVAKDAGVKVE